VIATTNSIFQKINISGKEFEDTKRRNHKPSVEGHTIQLPNEQTMIYNTTHRKIKIED
jgi:hypothetical protein